MSEIKTKEYEKPENIINPNSEISIEVKNLGRSLERTKVMMMLLLLMMFPLK